MSHSGRARCALLASLWRRSMKSPPMRLRQDYVAEIAGSIRTPDPHVSSMRESSTELAGSECVAHLGQYRPESLAHYFFLMALPRFVMASPTFRPALPSPSWTAPSAR